MVPKKRERALLDISHKVTVSESDVGNLRAVYMRWNISPIFSTQVFLRKTSHLSDIIVIPGSLHVYF